MSDKVGAQPLGREEERRRADRELSRGDMHLCHCVVVALPTVQRDSSLLEEGQLPEQQQFLLSTYHGPIEMDWAAQLIESNNTAAEQTWHIYKSHGQIQMRSGHNLSGERRKGDEPTASSVAQIRQLILYISNYKE